jgi:Domain of unknown function (DUF4440)
MSNATAELTELTRAFTVAERNGDAEFFRRHLADGLRFRRASGKVIDKVAFIKDLSADGNSNELLEAEGIEVLPYNESLALCSLLIRFKGMRGGAPVNGVFRNTRVFARIEAGWTCTLWFNTKESPLV